jgi:hypothetical protein
MSGEYLLTMLGLSVVFLFCYPTPTNFVVLLVLFWLAYSLSSWKGPR